MTSIMPPPDDAPFEERVRYYKRLAKISPDVVSGLEIRAMARRWLKEHDISQQRIQKDVLVSNSANNIK